MEPLDPPPSVLGMPNVGDAAFVLVAAAEALSKAAQAIAEAAQAMSLAIHTLDALSGQEVTDTKLVHPPGDTSAQRRTHGNLRSDSMTSEPVMERNLPSAERNGEFIQDEERPSLSESPSIDLEPTHESNNKCAMESSPDLTEFDLPTTGLNIPGPAPQTQDDSGSECDPSDIRSLAHTYPKLPLGRNYVKLDQYSDTVPLIACMALQSHKTICIIHTPMSLSLYAKIFKSITKFEVTYPENTDRMSSVEDSLQVLREAISPMMLLLTHDSLSDALLKWAEPDCVIHWGLPVDLKDYVKQISLLELTTQSCLILPPGDGVGALTSTQMLNYGVVAYPTAALKAYFAPDSLFREVRVLSAPALASVDLHNPSFSLGTNADTGTAADLTHVTSGHCEASSSGAPIGQAVSGTPKKIPQPVTPQSVTPLPRSSCPLPQGHYYIVLNEPLDAVPLIAHLATHHGKALCYLPVVEVNSGTAYQQLFNHITNIPTAYCGESNPKKLGVAMSSFGGMKSAIILRPVNDAWDSCFRKNHTDCLIYWGLPGQIGQYRRQCQLKVAHSYMIITLSQSAQLMSQQSSKQRAHPASSQFNDGRSNSVLHDMRQKTGNALSTISNPPISVSQYKALLKRRNLQPGTSV